MRQSPFFRRTGIHMARSAIIRAVAVSFFLLLALETLLQYDHNRIISYNTTGAMVTNIQEIVAKNEESIETLSDTLKDEYKARVKSAAYALSLSQQKFSVEDYRSLAQAMGFDEVHVFNQYGCIVDGSEPKYWGMSFSSGEQMSYFLPMLSDYELVMCQDMTPNTAEEKPMMYAICWLPDHTRLLQVGVTPERLLAEIEKSQSATLVPQISFIEDGILVCVVNSTTRALVTASDSTIVTGENTHFDEIFRPLLNSGKAQYRSSIAGVPYYISAAEFGGYYIAAAQSLPQANQGLKSSTIILALALLVSIGLIGFVQHRFAGIEAGQQALVQKSNEALAENNDIIACANIGIWHIILFEGEKPRMKANPKMRELLALPEEITDEAEIYQFWYSRIPPEALESVTASTSQMIAGEKSENTYLWNHPTLGLQYVRCGGTALSVECRGYILRGYHYNVNAEILQERRHEQEMAQALRDAEQASVAKTTFLNHMSHDIRTPMNAIIGYTNIAKKQNRDAAVAAALDKISSSSDHLLSLINDVLDISRIESGKARFVPAPVDLRRVVEDILAIARGNLDGRELTLTEDCNISFPYVSTDALRIREIIINLLGNSIKFTPDGGTVSFRLETLPQGEQVLTRITVSDTGIGMSPEFLTHIFEEFSQENSDARTQYKGTGLGMPIVKRYLDLMGGTIQIESQKGVGTTFHVAIPMERVKESDIPAAAPPSENVQLRGMRVLLAEDNDLNAEIARNLLEELGMQVTHVSDGEQAVEVYLAHPENFDVILMDIMMPVLNGYQATQQIRQQGGAAGRTVPIIAMTANTFAEDIQAARDACMDGHISKPIHPQSIKEALADCIGKEQKSST